MWVIKLILTSTISWKVRLWIVYSEERDRVASFGWKLNTWHFTTLGQKYILGKSYFQHNCWQVYRCMPHLVWWSNNATNVNKFATFSSLMMCKCTIINLSYTYSMHSGSRFFCAEKSVYWIRFLKPSYNLFTPIQSWCKSSWLTLCKVFFRLKTP